MKLYNGLPIFVILFHKNGIVGGQDWCDQTYMGKLRTGIISSDNFPFDYRTQKQCTHRIYLEQGIIRPNQTVCFTFNRFHLEDSADCQAASLEFSALSLYIRYCGRGQWHLGGSTADPRSTIFTENLCWPVEFRQSVMYFDVEFIGNFMGYKGYYGTFEIFDVTSDVPKHYVLLSPTGKQLPTERLVATNAASAPCEESEYTCFNRKCVLLAAQCDGTDDCGDGSDEDFTHARCDVPQTIDACNFEQGSCGFSLGNMVISMTSQGGPRNDHSFGKVAEGYGGHFVYPDYGGDRVASLIYENKPIYGSGVDMCLSFWYFMSTDVGSLSVYVRHALDGSGRLVPAWWRQDNYGAVWRQGELDVPAATFPLLEMYFMTHKGADDLSHIGIDDISFREGKCSGIDESCSFELNFCGWTLDKTTSASWERRKGPSLSRPYSGPVGDARTGDGHYLYLGSSKYEAGDTARVVSRPISFVPNRDQICLQYWYFMFGRTVSWLKIRLLHHDGHQTVHFSLNGDQGDQWLRAQHSIDAGHVNGPFQISIEGVVGSDGHSDIAIDDVIIIHGSCTAFLPTSTAPIPTTVIPTCAPDQWMCDNGECIHKSLVCDGRFDCIDKSDEEYCDYKVSVVGVVVGVTLSFLVLATLVIMGVFYRRKQRQAQNGPASGPTNFDLDISGPQVFDEDFSYENTGLYDEILGYENIYYNEEPPPPYTGGPRLPAYVNASSPPSYARSIPAAAVTPPSNTLTVSVTYPSEPPPSYEIAIVATPNLDTSLETSRNQRTPSRANTPQNVSHDTSAQQISIRISSSRSASRDTLNQSFSSERGGSRSQNSRERNGCRSQNRERGASRNHCRARSGGARGASRGDGEITASRARSDDRRTGRRSEEDKNRDKRTNSDAKEREGEEDTRRRILRSVSQPAIIGQGALGGFGIGSEAAGAMAIGDVDLRVRPDTECETTADVYRRPASLAREDSYRRAVLPSPQSDEPVETTV